jgi:hypothetical protein
VVKCTPQIDEVSDFTENHSLDMANMKHPLDKQLSVNQVVMVLKRSLRLTETAGIRHVVIVAQLDISTIDAQRKL